MIKGQALFYPCGDERISFLNPIFTVVTAEKQTIVPSVISIELFQFPSLSALKKGNSPIKLKQYRNDTGMT